MQTDVSIHYSPFIIYYKYKMPTYVPSFYMPSEWQRELQLAIDNPLFLLKLLKLPPPLNLLPQSAFNLRVPRGYVARMRQGDPNDPLLRQVLPLLDETVEMPQFSIDPLNEQAVQTVTGLLHKYHGRVLLVTTKACAIHCRYCFRRHYSYQPLSISTVIEAIRADTSIQEVILSGGDPLTLTDNRLAELAHQLATIPQIQRLRVHTRLPIVLPERVNSDLLTWLTGTRLQPVIVVHANHPNELNHQVNQALHSLIDAGITVLNQTVLLRGVNDQASILIQLSEALFSQRVLPYYLHLLDRVQGTAHFEVPLTQATQILEQMRCALPGYLVPQMVREIAGMAYKQPIISS